ncbi:5'-AMP-activated protein kinase subunit beta-2-like [Oscarella lobularis]|uniref:5'-AMP-activated protein kinase subunit beta-2-like n=1 Tax=Oscarella lobularis TaxID=121494 RepID=UPI0033140870
MGQTQPRYRSAPEYVSETLDVTANRRRFPSRPSRSSGVGSTTSKPIPVVFRWPSSSATDVSVSGTFADWKTLTPLHRSSAGDGDFVATIDLPEGVHQYRYIVDGTWTHDPNEAHIAAKTTGDYNNIMKVIAAETDVDEAIEQDIALGQMERAESPTTSDEYGQIVPDSSIYRDRTLGPPPWLPAQLLQTILNAESTSHEDPSLLVEPPRVVLGHLYAKSIRDDVLMISTTHRYRQKFVTTMLYKDISQF